MAMLITKFHKLIQNRILWLFFLVIIVISFVFWGTQVPTGSGDPLAGVPGELNGEPVSREEFEQARQGQYLALVLASGRAIPMTSELQKDLIPLTWRRMVSLRAAEELGLSASDTEVRESLRDQPAFSNEAGQFDPNAYRNFVKGYLGNLLNADVPLAFFEQHIRRQLTLAKLQHMLRQTALVSPVEVEQSARLVTDSLQAAYAVVRESNLAEVPEVGLDEARALYESDPAAFTLPEQVRVRYVAFEAADFLEQAAIEPEAVTNFYNDHISEFRLPDDEEETDALNATNEVAETDSPSEDAAAAVTGEVADASDTNATEVSAAEPDRTFQPFAEVAASIEEQLRSERALQDALDAAGSFVVELAPDQSGQAPSFDELAAREGLQIRDLPPFSEEDYLPQFGATSSDFVSHAFRLAKNREDYFSDAVLGDQAAYVIALEERMPAHTPPFEEVEQEALAAAREAAAADALTALAAKVREQAQQAAEQGIPMMQAFEEMEIEVLETGPFSYMEGLRDNPYANALRRKLLTMNAGEVGEPVPVFDGLLVAQLLRRESLDEFMLASISDQIRQEYSNELASRLYPAWQEQLLEAANFVDYDTRRREAAAEALAAEEAAEAARTADEGDGAEDAATENAATEGAGEPE